MVQYETQSGTNYVVATAKDIEAATRLAFNHLKSRHDLQSLELIDITSHRNIDAPVDHSAKNITVEYIDSQATPDTNVDVPPSGSVLQGDAIEVLPDGTPATKDTYQAGADTQWEVSLPDLLESDL